MPNTQTESNKVAKQVTLTEVERSSFIHIVEEQAKKRRMSIGKLKEDDFFCGAMASMFALGIEPPAGWIIGIMVNRPEMYGMERKRGKGR